MKRGETACPCAHMRCAALGGLRGGPRGLPNACVCWVRRDVGCENDHRAPSGELEGLIA